MKKFINIATALSLAAAMASCSMTENTPARHDLQDKQRLHDIRNSLPETIRVFDPGEFFPTDTKSDLGLPVDIQSDALDYDNASALSNSLYDYVQIPIHASTPLDYASVRFPLIPDGKTPSETAASKAFLIVQTPKDSAWTAAYTVTIFPHPDYMTQGQLDSLDFLYDGFFNAVFIYADLGGKVFKTETYIHGTLWKTGTVNTAASVPEDSSAVTADGDTVISALTPKRSMTDNTIFIPELIFTADRINKYDAWVFGNSDPNHPSNHDGPDIREFLDHLTNPFGGGGGGSDGDKQPTCKVSITTDGRGEVSGEGEYTAYETVTCTASPHMAGDIQTSEFIQWTGDISSSSQTLTFSAGDYLLRGQVSLTAVFHDFNPCADEENDRRDPLREMRIQASGAGGWNIEGGTLGWTRNGGSTRHKGMDFACPVGTPVFATHDGIVKNIRTGFTNGECWESYQERTGVGDDFKNTFGCGNGVDIECTINGRTYIVHYWHLTSAYGNLTAGESVKAGDIIGISGNSGSAAEESSGGPHLHYQIDGAGQPVNPSSFIYAIFDNNWKLTNPCNDYN